MWTAVPLAATLWNVTHWRNGPYVSNLCRRHRITTAAVLVAYMYHFTRRPTDG
jgi:hypothetical protein